MTSVMPLCPAPCALCHPVTVLCCAMCRTLEQTGGGSSLTTTPSEELTIPYTTTATQTLTSAAGYVAGTISMQNTLSGTISITSVAVDVGSGGSQTLALSSCTTTQVAAGASTSCSFNVTAPNAPAAGSVTATVGYTPSGGEAATQSSTATSYTFTSECVGSLACEGIAECNARVLWLVQPLLCNCLGCFASACCCVSSSSHTTTAFMVVCLTLPAPPALRCTNAYTQLLTRTTWEALPPCTWQLMLPASTASQG